jgi:hypothetical protein
MRAKEFIIEGTGKQITVQQLATISDAALDTVYHYGRSQPGNTFGWQANLKSAAFAKQLIDAGVADIEKISDAIHKGWNITAQAFVKNPMMFDDSKTMAPEKLQAKIAQRQKLMTQQYAQLPEEEKEKDRVVARAMLQAITGQQIEEGWKQNLAAAGLGTALALGGTGAQANPDPDSPIWGQAMPLQSQSSEQWNDDTLVKDLYSDIQGPDRDGDYKIEIWNKDKLLKQLVTKNPQAAVNLLKQKYPWIITKVHK